MRDKIRFAIVGYGNIGKRYAGIISSNPRAELVALIDTAFNSQSPNAQPQKYTDIEAFLNNDDVCDIVIVATPNGLHATHAAMCLKAGKHVLVEKPIAFTVTEIEKLIQLASERNRHLFPVWQIRYSPYIKTLKALIDSGELGKIFWLQADCFWNRGEQYYHGHSWHGTIDMDGGPLYTQFSHVIDLFSWLCGTLVVQDPSFFKIRTGLKTQFEDSGAINFKLDNDAVALISYTTSAPEGTSSNEMTLITEKAKIQLSGKYFEELVVLNTNDPKIERIFKSCANPIYDIAKHCSLQLIDTIIDTLQQNRLVDNAKDLIQATNIIEQIYKQRGDRFRSLPLRS